MELRPSKRNPNVRRWQKPVSNAGPMSAARVAELRGKPYDDPDKFLYVTPPKRRVGLDCRLGIHQWMTESAYHTSSTDCVRCNKPRNPKMRKLLDKELELNELLRMDDRQEKLSAVGKQLEEYSRILDVQRSTQG